MTDGPLGLDALLAQAELVVNCEHRSGSWFDRAVCPPPCNTMHDRCVECGESFDDCSLLHRPMLARWGNRHTIPAEVCDTCSDPARGKWVAVSFCHKAYAKLQAVPDCAYTYGVLRPEGDNE